MQTHKFSNHRIDEQIIKVGVDIRPPFEPKLDFSKLLFAGSILKEDYPQLFESLVQAPAEFRIMKKFFFTGNREIEAATLTTTSRGIVFTFPKRIAAINEEIEMDNFCDIAVESLEKIQRDFPQKKIIRVGLVNEYIFDTAGEDAREIICERFTKLSPAPNELLLRINYQTDDYNRIIEMQPLLKIKPVPEIPGRAQGVGYGLQVKVDFNNRDTSGAIDRDVIYRIIRDAEKYNRTDLYVFLNGGEGR